MLSAINPHNHVIAPYFSQHPLSVHYTGDPELDSDDHDNLDIIAVWRTSSECYTLPSMID